LEIATGTSKEDILTQAKADKKVAEHLQGNEPKKSIYVPNKLVNFVV
jgi:leucyl-tRNA synthetase